MSPNNRKNVFISGSAYEYGNFGDEGKHFIKDLSTALLQNDCRITSGFGLGVGPSVVEAVLENICEDDKANIADKLQVFPFPPGHYYSEEIKTRYRTHIMARTEIALFIFGNKLDDISVKESEGMWKEFEVASSNRALLIPVGACGYAAGKLWKRMIGQYDDYFATREKYGLFEKLGDPSATSRELIDLVVAIMNGGSAVELP